VARGSRDLSVYIEWRFLREDKKAPFLLIRSRPSSAGATIRAGISGTEWRFVLEGSEFETTRICVPLNRLIRARGARRA